MNKIRYIISIIISGLIFTILLLISFLAKFSKKTIDIGLGPQPLINNVHHKKCLIKKGYTCETFVSDTWFITDDFDYNFNIYFNNRFNKIKYILIFFFVIFRYRCLYLYFDGGPLGFMYILWRFEPYLLRLANVKTVVMPYGGDVQDFSLSQNLLFKNANAIDYPMHRLRKKNIEKRVNLWTMKADHIISGCEWVYYMHHWDTLMLAHFSIDTDEWKPVKKSSKRDALKLLHAPNHRTIKGTNYLVDAVEELQSEGYELELILLEGQPNSVIKDKIIESDLVVDQLIVGWYAMFAIESMSLGKPVICFQDETLLEFYYDLGLLNNKSTPLINAKPSTIKKTLVYYMDNKHLLDEIGKQGREFVLSYHSLDAIGKYFDEINKKINI